MSDKQKPRIALLASPESGPLVLYGLYDVLSSVGVVYLDMVAGEPGESLLDVVIAAASGEPFRCFGNVLIEPRGIDDIETVDVVIVCDMYTAVDTPLSGRYGREIAWLKRMHAGGALITSVCSGSLVLAEAGLLDGGTCSAHWAYRNLFRKHYPRVRLIVDSILNLDGEARGIVTAAGVMAWQDLALYLITRLCGPHHALRAAKIYLLSNHEDGQLPYADMGRLIQKDDAVIAECQSWIADNYAVPNPVATMGQRSGLKPRTFARRFKAATGYLPMDYVHGLRIEEAKRLIEKGAGAIDDIGFRVGYEDSAFFRRLFKRTAGLTPAAYRRKFVKALAAE